MESGTGLELWGFSDKHHSKKTWVQTIKLANCTRENTSEVLNCLQSLTTEQLNRVEREFLVNKKSKIFF